MSMALPLPQPEQNPRAIREALLPDDRVAFDAQYRRLMRQATDTLDLNPVLQMLEQWRVVAWSSQDPAAHRRMLDTVQRLDAGEDVPTEAWPDTKRRLGL
ncbi:DUF6247 family protein [Spongisporangium articulatum]|uniref:DUF6247 family protein n=1 Tax=Spongisporangium articulatum TaxID=3362603 RepID=A0ABW8APX6_9ACTN